MARDTIDALCESWAAAYREAFVKRYPTQSKDVLGSVHCTLAARRDLHHGSRSGRVEQQWPEFPFRGDDAMVNAVYKHLPEPLQEVMVVRYVVLRPRDQRVRADLMGLSWRVWYDRVGRVKSAVDGALAIVSASEEPKKVCAHFPEIAML
jgi:hypothetical protein